MGGDRWRLGHRPALDGLRGVAILLVLAHHARLPGTASAGVIGVTVFFVLSGFLITGLLLEERERAGRICFRRFYARRARRLLPAFLVLLAAAAVARLVLGDWFFDWWVFAAVLGYLGNWPPALGYDPGALGALWTLAVEEQFYLLWPLAVAAMDTRRRVMLLATLAAMGSLWVRLVLLADGATYERIYVGSDTVAFALLVGAITVTLRKAGGPGDSRAWVRWLCLTAVAAMCVPSGLWLVVTFPLCSLVAAVLVWHCTGQRGAGWLETSRLLRWFGSRSYGIYLWHAPLLWAMADHYLLPWPVLLLTGVPVALLLAEASYRWVEAPFRARHSARVAQRVTVSH